MTGVSAVRTPGRWALRWACGLSLKQKVEQGQLGFWAEHGDARGEKHGLSPDDTEDRSRDSETEQRKPQRKEKKEKARRGGKEREEGGRDRGPLAPAAHERLPQQNREKEWLAAGSFQI